MYKIIPATYVFTHVYLNTMQQGIQSLHATVELFIQNRVDPDLLDKVYEWAESYKTVRILSAGGGEFFDESLLESKRLAEKYGLPWASFNEPDIRDMITAVAMVVTPEMVFEVENAQEALEMMHDNNLDYAEGHELAQFLSEFHTAR